MKQFQDDPNPVAVAVVAVDAVDVEVDVVHVALAVDVVDVVVHVDSVNIKCIYYLCVCWGIVGSLAVALAVDVVDVDVVHVHVPFFVAGMYSCSEKF